MSAKPADPDQQLPVDSVAATLDRNTALQALTDLIRPSVAWAFWGEFLPTLALLLITWVVSAKWIYPFAIQTGGWGIPIYVAACSLLAVWITRLFVVQHDAGHNALSQSRMLNLWIGHFCSVFTFTPFLARHRHHWHHHMTSGNIETQDGLGDIYTLTVSQYRALAGWQQTAYRFTRSRCWFLFLMPTGLFLILQRFPLVRFPFSSIFQKPSRAELINTFVLDAIYVAIGWLVISHWSIVAPWVISYFIATVGAATLGVILFYTQHQFESTYYANNQDWSFNDSVFRGSMTLRMPFTVMEWAIGYINFHTLHHLKPNIPMYNLNRCHFRLQSLDFKMPECRLSGLWKTFHFFLWDESRQRMISFTEYDASKK